MGGTLVLTSPALLHVIEDLVLIIQGVKTQPSPVTTRTGTQRSQASDGHTTGEQLTLLGSPELGFTVLYTSAGVLRSTRAGGSEPAPTSVHRAP